MAPDDAIGLDELALGLGVRLSVIGESAGEPALERGVFTRERGVCAQSVAEAQVTVEFVLLWRHDNGAASYAMGGTRIAPGAAGARSQRLARTP